MLTEEGQKVIASAGYVGINGEMPANEFFDFNKDINESFDIAWDFYLSSGINAFPSATIVGTPQVEELSAGKRKSMTILWVVPCDDGPMRYIVLTREKDGIFEIINEGEALDFDGENIILPG